MNNRELYDYRALITELKNRTAVQGREILWHWWLLPLGSMASEWRSVRCSASTVLM